MFTFNKYQTFPEWLKGRQSQTAGKDADIRTGDIMLSHYTKNGTRVDQKHFDNGDGKPWSNSEIAREIIMNALYDACLLYTSPSPRDVEESRMPSSA